MENIIVATAKDIDTIIDRCEYLLIEFSAQWCAPCRVFEKVIETVAPLYPEFTFATIDIDKEKSLATEFAVRSVPSVMILRNKVVLYADAGALSVSALCELLDKAKVVA
jgi:thioredoxin 1